MESKNQTRVVLCTTTADATSRRVLPKEEIGMIQVEIEDEMRPYPYGERQRPTPDSKRLDQHRQG